MPREYLERELKFDLPEEFDMPDLGGVVGATAETESERLSATYYDTDNRHLQRMGITLRRRSGGHDDGWHVKIPAGQGRLELQVDSRATTPPRQLSELLTGVRLAQPLRPRVKLDTRRERHLLRDAHGRELAEIADDYVRATTGGTVPTPEEWREVEVELGPAGDEELLLRLAKALEDRGARPSDHPSKYARAIGPAPATKRLTGLAWLVGDYLQAQRDAIAYGDLRMRRGENAVHKTRVAVRRTRSTLRVFSRLFDADRAEHLDAELRWYADVLGRVRDLDIVRERLASQIDGLEPELVLGPVSANLDSWLAKERATAWEGVLTTLRSRRYRALLLELDRWQVETPWTGDASQKKSAATKYADKAARTARNRLERAVTDDGPNDDFHRARKATKRWRYGLELCSPHLGRTAKKQVSSLKRLQDDLGKIQDTVMTREVLRRMATRTDGAAGESAFTYGLLYTREELHGAQARQAIAKRYP